MLSIIICSINNKLFNDVSENISKTIGFEYEIIRIVNKENKYSLPEALNKGGSLSKFEYLLFLHEDVLIHTENWGQVLINILQKKECGIVGISGAVYKSAYPSTWSMIPKELYRISSIQRWKDGKITKEVDDNEILSKVAVVDGVFMAMRKEVWKEFRYDESNIHGFHFYDIDLSLRLSEKYKIFVTKNILLEHFSEGNLGSDWIDESILFHKRYRKQLPVSSICIKKRDKKIADYNAITSFVFILIRNKKFSLALKYYMFCLKISIFNKVNITLAKSLLYSIFK